MVTPGHFYSKENPFLSQTENSPLRDFNLTEKKQIVSRSTCTVSANTYIMLSILLPGCVRLDLASLSPLSALISPEHCCTKNLASAESLHTVSLLNAGVRISANCVYEGS